MKGLFTLVVVSGLLLVALEVASACSPPQAARAVKLDASANGQKVELQRGKGLEISLEANPTTGYGWEVEEVDERVLRQVGEVEFKPESNLIGAPGVQILHFEAVGTGQTTLKLVYRRPWEKGVKPLKTYSIQVIVR